MSNKSAKLSVHDIQQLRYDYAAGKANQGQLARRYKISVIQVGRITRRECWQNISDFGLEPLDLEASARRLMAIQEETDASKKMQAAIEEQRQENQKGDAYLNELTGDQDAGSKRAADKPA